MEADGAGAAPRPSVRLTVAPEARLLATVRLVVATAARRAGVNDELVEDLKVAVSEICSTAVRARSSVPRGSIEVDLSEDGRRFVVEIRDRVQAVEPSSGALGSPDDRAFGLALAGSLVEELDSAPRHGGGYVTRFWLPARTGIG